MSFQHVQWWLRPLRYLWDSPVQMKLRYSWRYLYHDNERESRQQKQPGKIRIMIHSNLNQNLLQTPNHFLVTISKSYISHTDTGHLHPAGQTFDDEGILMGSIYSAEQQPGSTHMYVLHTTLRWWVKKCNCPQSQHLVHMNCELTDSTCVLHNYLQYY